MRHKPLFSVGIFLQTASLIRVTWAQPSCGAICSDELSACLGTANGDAQEEQKCHLYHFDCVFLCEDLSNWTCEDHCQSDYEHCMIGEAGAGCAERRDRCINCCPSAKPSLSPTPLPSTDPTGVPTPSPSKGPTIPPTIAPTNSPTLSYSPTNHLGDIEAAEIGVPIYPESNDTKTILLPKSEEGILLRLTKIGGDTNIVPAPPTPMPTAMPTTTEPTASPSKSSQPSKSPTKSPTTSPTKNPTRSPVASTAAPSSSPTSTPSKSPTDTPTAPSTDSPTQQPVQLTEPPTSQPTQQPTSSSGVGYILLPGDQYCPSGTDVSQEDCLAAGNLVTAHMTTITNRNNLNVNNWASLPCGCFIWANQLIDFDTNCNDKGLHPFAQPVCKEPTNQQITPEPTPHVGGFVLLSGSDHDQCPSGTEVTQEDCLAAANLVTAEISTVENRNSLTVYDYSFTPCGCFVWESKLINFDTNCDNKVLDQRANLVCKQNYELLPGESYSKCPEGLEVPQEDCLEVANSLTLNIDTITNRQSLTVADWGFTPCGCFIWQDNLIDFDPGCDNRVTAPSAELVCKQPANGRALNTIEDDYIVLSGSDYDQCPSGTDVSQEDCLAAGNLVTADRTTITNRQSLLVNDWASLPCGCFIWSNQLIDFDFNCANKGFQAAAELVCKNVTLSPVAAPTSGTGTGTAPTYTEGNKTISIPAGRSYDGRSWEKVHPLLMTFFCDAGDTCVVDLPPDSEGEGIYYVVEKYEPGPLSAEEETARLLIQATFGPNRESIENMLGTYNSASDWIKGQMTMPLTSHREHYRQRSNSAARNALEKFGMRDPHSAGSRWNRWAFDRYRDIGKRIVLDDTGSNTYVMRVDGIPRTEVDKQAFANSVLSSGLHFSIHNNLYICRGSSEFSSLPQAKLVLSNTEGCEMDFQQGHVKMPAVEFITDPTSLGLNVPDASLEELDPAVLDVKILASPLPSGSLGKTWPNFVRDTSTGEYYLEDRRVEMLEMNPNNISPEGLSSKTCPSVPKTFLNEETCVVRSDCAPPVYEPSTGTFTLDAINVRKFYDLGGHYVYRINDLPIITDPLSRYEMFSPCNDVNTIKRWNKPPHRFVKKCFGAGSSVTDTTIHNTIAQALASELATISDPDERNNKQVLDVIIPENACYDPYKIARGGRFNVVDSATGTTTCWVHSNPDEWSVYNFDAWLTLHPGNMEAFIHDRKNPIANFLESEVPVEDSITLNMPGWHPDDRFPSYKGNFIYIGNYGDRIDFANLPASVQEPEMASDIGAILVPDAVSEYVEVCSSPGEVANEPAKGHQYRLQKADETGEKGNDSLDQDGFSWNGKNRIFNTISTFAPDQLRQRIAWVLSSLIVVTSVDINREHSTEDWSAYHDIFVRNAFGNYFDVLKEVSFHKLMATMLTYHESKSMSHNFEEDGVMIFPDENFAREIMQLFTIGLYKLNQDGTMVMNEDGTIAETYTNDDIMTFSRAWTNFMHNDRRPNLEPYADFYHSDNSIDPMMFPTTDGRDVFPKIGLDDGGRVYIGDKVQRCDKMPTKPWLRKGANYIFRGSDPNVKLARRDPEMWTNPMWSDPQHYSRVVLDETSNLHSHLCNADPDTGACRFASTVILAEDVDCVGTCIAGENKPDITGSLPCECSIDEPRTVRVDHPAGANGDLPPVWYEYARDPCIQMAFPEPGYMKAVSEIGLSYPTITNDAMCADTRLAIAGTACCDPHNNEPKNICLFRGERTTYDTAMQRCEENGLVTCPWTTIPVNYHCGTDIQWDGDHYKAGMRFSWTNEDCSMKVQINEKGYVAMVHEVGSLSQEVKGRVRLDAGTYFHVLWDGDFPTISNGCGGGNCQVHHSTCLCSTTVDTSVVFDGSSIPTKDDLLSELHIGAPNPTDFDEGTYHKCTAPACNSADYSVHFIQPIVSNNALASAIDDKTIFEMTHPLTDETIFLSNTKSMVNIGPNYAFRNPPIFNSPVDQTQRDALAETDAVLQHYVHHSNTAPFIALRFIQHLVTSNPSPRYVRAVADAFRMGTYNDGINTFGSGKYGDLEAAVAAVFLDAEARSTTLDADTTHGRAREPLLKLIHFFRAMELDTVDGRSREVDVIWLKDKIGQESHYSPSVFSFFLPEYQPVGPVHDMDLVAPETQLFDAPKLIGFLNGMASLPYFGIDDCEGGKGFGPMLFPRYKIADHPDERWFQCHESGSLDPTKHVPHRFRWAPTDNASPAEIVSEIDLLLTGGKLSSINKEIITQAYSDAAATEGDVVALRYTMAHFAAAPEFQVTNTLFSNETQLQQRISTVPEIPVNPPPVTDYKAIVYLFLQGGLDSFSLLMPYTCANDLNAQYHQVRGNIAIANHLQLPINAGSSAQPCSVFGVHPTMGYLQQLYNSGEASFVANIGPLVEPIANNIEFEQGSKQMPPSLFAHNIQTAETQGVATTDPTAGGILGRIGDAINLQAGEEIFDAYSVFGTPKALEGAPGVSRPADVLTDVGVSTFVTTASAMETHIQEMNKHVADSIYGETYSESISSAIARKNLLEATIGDSQLSSSTESCFANLETTISNQFKQVARIITQRNKLQSKRDVFYVQIGTFDAHADSYFGTAEKLTWVNGALQCFVNDMKNQGIWNSVTVMSASEFGRTLTSNGAGTDHAWGGNHFIAGGSIAGGKIHGDYPDDLTDAGPLNIGRGRLIPTTSWEGIWKGVAEWFGVESENMDSVLPNLSRFSANIFSKGDLYKPNARRLRGH